MVKVMSVYSKYRMSSRGKGIGCGVIERVKRTTLRWFGHIESMPEIEMTESVYVSKVEVS